MFVCTSLTAADLILELNKYLELEDHFMCWKSRATIILELLCGYILFTYLISQSHRIGFAVSFIGIINLCRFIFFVNQTIEILCVIVGSDGLRACLSLRVHMNIYAWVELFNGRWRYFILICGGFISVSIFTHKLPNYFHFINDY